MIDFIKRIFLLRWLWSIFSGFYLVAYTFWVPTLFSDLPLKISVFVVTLIVGAGLVMDGFLRAMELEKSTSMPALPFRRVWRILGGIFLLGYLLVYIPPQGRIVAHWPLDLAITLVGGLVMLAYAVLDY